MIDFGLELLDAIAEGVDVGRGGTVGEVVEAEGGGQGGSGMRRRGGLAVGAFFAHFNKIYKHQ